VTNNPTGDEPVVTQRARDAAADLLGSATDGVREGRKDSLSVVRAFARFEQDTLSRGGREAFTADELYEMVRPIWHYAPRGTGDGNMFFASERGQMLMRSMEKIAAALSTAPASPEQADQADVLREALVEALSKVTPIRVHNGPDYAEVYFADGSAHSTQAMTMNPQDWLDLQAAYEAITKAQEG